MYYVDEYLTYNLTTMSSVEYLRAYVSERLTAAAEEIFGVFKRTIVEYEEEIDRQRRLLDIVWKPGIEAHRTELPQQHVCKEEEVVTEQQLCIEERNSSVEQEDPEPPQIKEEEEEVCSSQEGEQLVLKQETDGFMLTPTDEGSDHSEDQTLDFIHDDTLSAEEKGSVVNIPVISYVIPNSDHQLLSHNSHVAESQDQEGGHHGDSGSSWNAVFQPKQRHHESESLTNHVYNSTMSNIHGKTYTGEKSFKCDTCGKAFKFKSQLYIHLRIHTGDKPYSCKTCGKDFRYNSHLIVHMTTHTGEKPYSCKICGKEFRHNSRLNVHMRIHTGEKPYLCKTCGNRFCELSVLKRHMRIHTGEKPFTCKICGRAFRRNGDLKVHMRTHTGERPYLCKTCGKRFSEVSALKKHMRIHTGEKPYTCEICGKDFRISSNLTVHMKRTHR